MIGACERCGRQFDSIPALHAHLEDHAWRDAHPTSTTYTREDLALLKSLQDFGAPRREATTS